MPVRYKIFVNVTLAIVVDVHADFLYSVSVFSYWIPGLFQRPGRANWRRDVELISIERVMQEQLSDKEKHRLEERLFELRQEHRDLDDVINRLLLSPDIEELQLKRFKKRKLKLKDTISQLENVLIPDILA